MTKQEIVKVLKDAYAKNLKVEMTQCGQTKIYEVDELPHLWVNVSEDEDPYPLASVRALELESHTLKHCSRYNYLIRQHYEGEINALLTTLDKNLTTQIANQDYRSIDVTCPLIYAHFIREELTTLGFNYAESNAGNQAHFSVYLNY